MTLVQTEPKKIYIRVDEHWQPWENTLLYMPFSWNYNDSMGNTVSLLYGSSPTYSTTGQGEQYANISNSRLWTTIDWVDINTWTNSIWLYKTSTTVDVIWYYGGNTTGQSRWGTGMFINNTRLTIFEYGWDVDTWVDITLNAWNNVVFTASNWTTKIYVNGALAATKSKTYNKRGNIFRMFYNPYVAVNNYVWWADELIFENKVRTSDQVLNYYNLTKWNYWIS